MRRPPRPRRTVRTPAQLGRGQTEIENVFKAHPQISAAFDELVAKAKDLLQQLHDRGHVWHDVNNAFEDFRGASKRRNLAAMAVALADIRTNFGVDEPSLFSSSPLSNTAITSAMSAESGPVAIRPEARNYFTVREIFENLTTATLECRGNNSSLTIEVGRNEYRNWVREFGLTVGSTMVVSSTSIDGALGLAENYTGEFAQGSPSDLWVMPVRVSTQPETEPEIGHADFPEDVDIGSISDLLEDTDNYEDDCEDHYSGRELSCFSLQTLRNILNDWGVVADAASDKKALITFILEIQANGGKLK